MPNRNGAGVSKRFGQFASWQTVAQAVRHQARLERFSGPSGWNSGAAARWQSAALRRGQLSARKRPRASWRCGAFLPLPAARPRVSQPVARNSAAHGVAPTPKRPAAAGGFAAVPAFAGRHAPGPSSGGVRAVSVQRLAWMAFGDVPSVVQTSEETSPDHRGPDLRSARGGGPQRQPSCGLDRSGTFLDLAAPVRWSWRIFRAGIRASGRHVTVVCAKRIAPRHRASPLARFQRVAGCGTSLEPPPRQGDCRGGWTLAGRVQCMSRLHSGRIG
jgi:hypothetical protein